MHVFNQFYMQAIAKKYLRETLFKVSFNVIITLRYRKGIFQITTMKHTTEEFIFF